MLRFLFFLVLCTLTSLAWAVAGGGGGYSGGGGGGGGYSGGGGGYSGGSGSSDGEGLGILIYYLFMLCVNYPLIGIPLVIGIAFLFYWTSTQTNNSYRRKTLRRAKLHIQNDETRSLEIIRKTDSSFNLDTFYPRIEHAFRAIQAAWCAHKLEDIRAFVSDGIYERFSLQIDEQKSLQIRDHVDIVSWKKPYIIDVNNEGPFQSVTLRLQAHIKDVRTAIDANEVNHGMLQDYSECWTLIRRQGTKSLDTPGLIEGNCPNCGAALELNMHAECTYCQAVIRSGSYDWVLSEITQVSEWEARKNKLPGVDTLQERDKGFSLQHIEDRCSVAFYRYKAAERLGSVDIIRSVASPQFVEATNETLPNIKQNHQYHGDCAIGSVEVLGVDPGPTDSTTDTCLIEVRWNASVFNAGPKMAAKKLRRISPKTSYFIFSRAKNANSNVEHAISSAHCLGCGAPQQNYTDSICAFCGAELNNSDQQWQLIKVLPWSHKDARKAKKLLNEHNAIATTPARGASATAVDTLGTLTNYGTARYAESCLAWIIQVSLSDGFIDEHEQRQLEHFAAKNNIKPELITSLIHDIQARDVDLPLPKDIEEVQYYLDIMIHMALADNTISYDERGLINKMCSASKLHSYDINLRINKIKAERHRAAKAALRN